MVKDHSDSEKGNPLPAHTIDPTTYRIMTERSYHGATSRSSREKVSWPFKICSGLEPGLRCKPMLSSPLANDLATYILLK